MSASLSRSFSRLRCHILRRKSNAVILKQSSCLDHNNVNDSTVPYLPAEMKKRSVNASYPQLKVSYKDFKHVERLLPSKTIPLPAEQEVYPSPSGWVPSNESLQPKEYAVRRTRNHLLPCYYRKHFDGRETTYVKRVYGDIWKLRDDVAEYFADEEFKVDIQVHEFGRWIRVRGNYLEKMAQFLLSKGF